MDLSAFCCETTAGRIIYLGIFMADLLYKIHCTGWMGDVLIENLYTLCPKAYGMLKLQTVL